MRVENTLTQLLSYSFGYSLCHTPTFVFTRSLAPSLAHWQILADPEAADAVLTSGANITVVGLNVTSHVTLQGQSLEVESIVTLSVPCGARGRYCPLNW